MNLILRGLFSLKNLVNLEMDGVQVLKPDNSLINLYYVENVAYVSSQFNILVKL